MARYELRSHLRPWGRRWTWQLIANNGEPMATSEPYNSIEAALDGIAVVRSIAPDAFVDERQARK